MIGYNHSDFYQSREEAEEDFRLRCERWEKRREGIRIEYPKPLRVKKNAKRGNMRPRLSNKPEEDID